MSARARNRTGKESTGSDRRRWWIAAAVVIAAFIIGFGVTALSFNRATGADVVTVPDVRELTVDDARRALGRTDLELVVRDTFPNAAAPVGAVLAQSPLPGQEVSPGSQVEVFVSTGAPRPTVPQVQGMAVALATRALQTAGFQVTVRDTPGIGETGSVVGTDPPSGTAVQLPATVDLWVSSGEPWIEMPALIGMLEEDARTAVEAAGLSVTEVLYERSELGELGGVVGQEPAPGDSVQLGTDVRLRVIAADSRTSLDGRPSDRGRSRER